MEKSGTKYHLNCLTSFCRREKKRNRVYYDEPVDKQIVKSTLAISFHNTTSTKFEVSTLNNPAPKLIITISLFQMFSAKLLPYKQSLCKTFVVH